MVKFLQAFKSRRVWVMSLLGLASGLPNPLTGDTLTAWMTVEQVNLTTIGIFAWVALPYNFKFLWAPLVDRYQLPWFSRRRDWMLLTQLLLAGCIVFLGSLDPRAATATVAAVAVGLAFFSATQDVAVDAYRSDVLQKIERGSGTAVFVAGYRVALIVAGALALVLTEWFTWQGIYWMLGGLMALCAIGTWLAPPLDAAVTPPRTLAAAVVLPFADIFKRKGWYWLLAFVALYKFGDALASHLITPFLVDLGFKVAEVGAIKKGLGLVATIGGSLVGGGLMASLGLFRSLLLFGVLQAVANLGYLSLALTGPEHGLLVAVIIVDNICGGLGSTAFVAFLMSVCSLRFSAAQYALLSSASSLGGRLVGGAGGAIVESWGWPLFFAISIAVAAPALTILTATGLARGTGAPPPEEPPPPAEPSMVVEKGSAEGGDRGGV
jgi:PAT family beta-lactamase induction signal transducer AmpG